MKKYVYLWGGSEVDIVDQVTHEDEQDVDRVNRLKDGAREAWEREHPGKFLQLVVSESHPRRMR